jgi:hypothetical protein
MPHLHPHSHNFRDWLYAFAPVGLLRVSTPLGALPWMSEVQPGEDEPGWSRLAPLPCSGVFLLNCAYRVGANLKLSAGVDSLFG